MEYQQKQTNLHTFQLNNIIILNGEEKINPSDSGTQQLEYIAKNKS